MSLWEDFLDDVFGDIKQPGTVMICFVNRYLEGMDDVKYKIKYDGHEKSGVTTAQNYCIELTPTSFKPIQIFVWSRKAKAWKKLDDVVAEPGRKKLVRKMMRTIKVPGKTDDLPDTQPNKRPDQPAPAPAPGPSPTDPQGITPDQTKNENDQPQAKPRRPVPGEITAAQLKKIFPAAKDDFLQGIADECNKDLVKYHLDTPLRRAHFFAQIKGETGAKMKPVNESWEYSPAFLKTFSYYKKHPDEATQDGYLLGTPPKINGRKNYIRHANQDAIGKKHFSKLNGNRADHPGDGLLFKGRGLIQITGYEKYAGFMGDYSKYFDGQAPDSINNPDVINQAPYAIRSAIWFWLWRKAYLIADQKHGIEDVRKITFVVNGGYNGLVERQNAYKLAEAAFK
jgi:putative chitinase